MMWQILNHPFNNKYLKTFRKKTLEHLKTPYACIHTYTHERERKTYKINSNGTYVAVYIGIILKINKTHVKIQTLSTK